MGRILVLYHSNDGNTEAMSELVAEGCGTIPGHEIRRRSCDEATHEDVRWADGIACGGPTNLGGIAWRMKKFWDEFAADNWGKCDGKFFVVFSSQGGHGGGAEHTCQAMTTVLENFGWMHCPVTDYVSPIHTLHYGACVAKMPRNEEDKAVCRRAGLRLAEWVAVFVDGRKSLHPLLTTKRVDAIKEEHFRAAKEAKKKGLPPPPEPDEAAIKPDIPDWNPHNAVHVVVVKDVPIDAQADWLAMAEKLAMGTWREQGCLKYNFIRSSSSPTRFVINEEWESQAHLDAHFETPHFKELVPKMDAISSTVSIDVCHDALARYAPRVAPGSVPHKEEAISGPVKAAS